MGNVTIPANERSVNGAFDSQLLLHRFGVTLQVSVWLSRFVDIEFIILRVQSITKMRDQNHMVVFTCACMCCAASHLDHVKVILIGENSIHLTVQLFESVLNGVGCQCVVGSIFTEEMVACAAKTSH